MQHFSCSRICLATAQVSHDSSAEMPAIIAEDPLIMGVSAPRQTG